MKRSRLFSTPSGPCSPSSSLAGPVCGPTQRASPARRFPSLTLESPPITTIEFRLCALASVASCVQNASLAASVAAA